MKRYLTVSDLSGEPIYDESSEVVLAVLKHPDLEQAIQLDASDEEVEVLKAKAKKAVLVEIIADGGDNRETIILDLDDFNAAFKVEDIQTVLEEAENYRPGGSVSAPAPTRTVDSRPRTVKPAADKVNYKELPHAGMPHRGRTTEEEALIVRENLDEVNKNRIAAGHPPIDPDNEKDAARYGFKAGSQPAFSG